jgi:DNA-binding protein YbaB
MMFESLKAAQALAGLMKNREALEQAGKRVQERLGELRAVGSSGSGAVRVEMNGKMQVLRVQLDPALFAGGPAGGGGDPAVRAYVESLIADACNDAQRIAQMMSQKEIAREAEAMGISGLPGLDKLMGG